MGAGICQWNFNMPTKNLIQLISFLFFGIFVLFWFVFCCSVKRELSATNITLNGQNVFPEKERKINCSLMKRKKNRKENYRNVQERKLNPLIILFSKLRLVCLIGWGEGEMGVNSVKARGEGRVWRDLMVILPPPNQPLIFKSLKLVEFEWGRGGVISLILKRFKLNYIDTTFFFGKLNTLHPILEKWPKLWIQFQ